MYKFIITLAIISILSCNSKPQPDPRPFLESSNAVVEVSNPENDVFWVSYTAGKQWQRLNNNLPDNTQVNFMTQHGKEILIATDNHGLYKANPPKNQWENIGGLLPSSKVNAVLSDSKNIWVGLFEKGIHYSSNDGVLWTNLNYNLADLRVRCIVKHADQLLIGNDTGIYSLNEEKQKWVPLIEGMQIVSLEANQEGIYAGTNKGVIVSHDQGQDWKWVIENGSIHRLELENNVIFACHISGQILSSEDSGVSWVEENYTPSSESYAYAVEALGNIFVLSNNHGSFEKGPDQNQWTYHNNKINRFYSEIVQLDGVLYAGTKDY